MSCGSAAGVVLGCGDAFDVVSAPLVFGRWMLDRLWEEGPGCGPVAVCRGRMLIFASPGTAQRLPSLLEWEEWGAPGRAGAVPPLFCHGPGDSVTVPALADVHTGSGTGDSSDIGKGGDAGRGGGLGSDGGRGDDGTAQAPRFNRPASRWIVAPDRRRPWLPGPEVLLWAAVRAARAHTSPVLRVSIFPPADQGAKVYDVSRRR
ncbi:hypothetical protein ACWD4G_04100 [Streptomyces sp. NPDC002643]